MLTLVLREWESLIITHFIKHAKEYGVAESEERALELCSLWEEFLRDSEWHPFKVDEVEGKHQVSNW